MTAISFTILASVFMLAGAWIDDAIRAKKKPGVGAPGELDR